MRDLKDTSIILEILTKKPEVFEALERRINQHRLVRATVFNLALISLSALIFFIARLGFTVRLFIAFLALSVVFVGFALFTGKRSAQTLYLELLYAYNSIVPSNESNDLEGQNLPSPLQEQRRPRAV